MTASKDSIGDNPTDVGGEKTGHVTDYNNTHHDVGVTGEEYKNESFMTRNGLSLDSFKKRDYGEGIVEMDRKMKPRHLHMIAIGGSIGAGFFVGSGGALAKGGPGSLTIDFIIMGVMIFNVGTFPHTPTLQYQPRHGVAIC